MLLIGPKRRRSASSNEVWALDENHGTDFRVPLLRASIRRAAEGDTMRGL